MKPTYRKIVMARKQIWTKSYVAIYFLETNERAHIHYSFVRSRGTVGCSGNGSHFRFYQNFIYRVSLPGLQRYVFDICFMENGTNWLLAKWNSQIEILSKCTFDYNVIKKFCDASCAKTQNVKSEILCCCLQFKFQGAPDGTKRFSRYVVFY